MVQKRRRKTRRKRQKSMSGWSILRVFVIVVTIAGIIYAIAQNFDYKIPQISSFSSTATEYAASDADSDELQEVKIPDGLPEEFVEYKGFNVSFNPELHIPNYVVYELTNKEADGNEARAKAFDCDDNVEGCPQPFDYTRSGYDRGHMSPAGDMKWDYEAMHQSFYMTNICPQRHALNGGGWKRLEEKVRDWAKRDSALIVVTGPIRASKMPTIGNGVAVPPAFFKVLLAPFAKPIRGIAFIYKNEGGQKRIEDQMVPIDSVEKATGMDFFSSLPDDLENKIERSSDYNEWNN